MTPHAPESGALRVAVLLGGTSAEHAVSLASGRQVLAALREGGHDVLPVLIERDGRWRVGATVPEVTLDTESGAAPPRERTTRRASPREGLARVAELADGDVDVVFIALHGPDGEDGAVQGLLALAGLPYTGSGLLASALAMDKLKTKELFRSVGVPVARDLVVTRQATVDAALLDRVEADVGLPCVVKPVCGGSSFGTSVVRERAALAAAVEAALAEDSRALVEELVEGVEVTCGVLGGGLEPVLVLPVTEIAPEASGFFDFHAKYTKGACREITPARLDAVTTARVQELAQRAHDALGCEGMSRTDFIVRRGEPVALETNTIPGMTATSLLPQGAAAADVSFTALVDRLVRSALVRAAGARE